MHLIYISFLLFMIFFWYNRKALRYSFKFSIDLKYLWNLHMKFHLHEPWKKVSKLPRTFQNRIRMGLSLLSQHFQLYPLILDPF